MRHFFIYGDCTTTILRESDIRKFTVFPFSEQIPTSQTCDLIDCADDQCGFLMIGALQQNLSFNISSSLSNVRLKM